MEIRKNIKGALAPGGAVGDVCLSIWTFLYICARLSPFPLALSPVSCKGQADLTGFQDHKGCCVIPTQSPLPCFFLLLFGALNPSISYQSPAPGAPSVPGAAKGRLLLSFHHCVSLLIPWPRLFRVSVCRGFPTQQPSQFHCG